MKNNHHQLSGAKLQKKAEVLSRKNSAKKVEEFSGTTKSTFIHDIEVDPIKPEKQFKALKPARGKSKITIKKHTELYDLAPFGYFALSKEGKINGLNIFGSQLLGEERTKLINKLFSFFVSKETKPIFLHFLKKIFITKGKQSCEVHLVPNGNLPLEVQLSGACVDNGEQCFLTVFDITGRKLIKDAELKREQLFQTLAEVAPVGIFHTDATGYTTYVNPSWRQITGLTDKEALGNKWLNAVHPDDKIKIRKGWKDATRKQDISVTEYRFVHPDGTITWVMGQAIPEKNLDNEVLGYVGSITDITQRKLIEEKQLEYQEFIKEMQVIANLGTFELDITGRKWTWSEVIDNIFGIDETFEKSYENWPNIIHPDWREPMSNYFMEEIIGKKKKFDFEYKIIRINDKTERWVHSLGRLKFNSNNQPIALVGTIQDITSRKQMQIELSAAREREEASNAKFKNYVENAPDGVFVTDEKGNYVEVNPAATLITGYSKEALLKMSIKDLTPPESMETAFNHFQTLLATGTSKGDIKFLHKNGSVRWWSVDAVQISDNQFLGFVKDITERKQAELEIKTSNERFELISRATNDALWDWHLETNQLWGNEVHQQMYGLTIADRVPAYNEWIQRIHPEDRERTVNAFEAARASQRNSHSEEYRFNTENSGWMHVFGRTLIERNEQGKAVRLIGSMTDISENKKAEIALKNAEERLNFLLSATPAIIYSCQADFPYPTTFISENITEQTGYKPGDFLTNSNFWTLNIHPEDREKVLANFQLLFETGHHTHEYRFRLKNGSYLWIHDELRLIYDDEGKPLEMVGYMINIDERKKAEESIRASEEKYRQLFESSPLPMWVYELKTFRILDVNEAAIQHYGYSKAEFINMKVLDLRLPEDIPRLLTATKKVFKELSSAGIWRHKKKDGTLIDVEVNAHDINFNQKQSRIVLINDITEKLKMAKALGESENRLRSIFNTEPECIKLLGPNCELLEMNPAGLAMIEADNMDLVKGKSVLGIIKKPYQKAYQNLVKNVFKDNSGKLEFEITGLRGTNRWVDSHVFPLKNAKGEIISMLGVTRDITEHKKTQEEIKNTTEQLRQLTAHLQSIREEERKRIGREIHDELGQQLTAIKMDVVWIDKKIPEENNALKNKLNNIITLLDGSNQSIRRIISELRPVIFDDYGLLEAMEWLGTQFTANTGIPVKFTTTETELKLAAPIATCIFRVYQEAFTNITRHALAKMVTTNLRIADGSIIVTILDDGKGFNPKAVQNNKSFGILGMKERVISLNGTFELIAVPQKGTKIIITLPYMNLEKVNLPQ